ncbi:MAG: DNA helicase RecQ [Pseudomonadales bacterium]|nr:DNA helicase RecQ [Pseudomonadales bacterium]MCP5329688.1 DNA helicase RecQ [Pseudomonadales bacterium]MCP5343773.1 DNA helicase RecQ [Pseudomonadales bacterium]
MNVTEPRTETPAEQVLHSTFGYPAFRGQQQAIIDTLLAGQNCLVLMPTGGGKSLCYQIPALLRRGVGVVVSPLIALMQDQVDALRELGVRASFLNSTLPQQEQWQVIEALRQGELDLLYVAPERLNQPATLQLLSEIPVALFAIDEAHCVSQWGHDFRADYLQLGVLQERFPEVPRIALTATADANTRDEIARRLGLEDAPHFISGFDRPNIQYRIAQKQNPRQQLLRFLRREHEHDAGIVYCLSRKKVEDTAAWLAQQGFDAVPYHAGLSAQERQRNQQRFLREDGVIVVATIAFGMGIDKPDVRFIVHLDLPKSLESYYQETGRAGRDGEPATAWMVYGLQDVIMLRQMMDSSQGSEQFKRIERARLDAMLGLCEITSCRRQALLHYFGEDSPERCGNCDTCLQPVPTWDGTEAARKALSCVYRTGQRFGVAYLIDVLLGAESDKIFQNDHHQVSTYGIGKELSPNAWRSVFRQLVARGYLGVDHASYGGLFLNEKSRALLKGEEAIALRVDTQEPSEKAVKKARSKHSIADADHTLWEALRECRKQLAIENDVAPYVIFHDASLMDMLHYRPLTEAQFLSISGVGQSKLEKYGAAFLEVIRAHEQ